MIFSCGGTRRPRRRLMPMLGLLAVFMGGCSRPGPWMLDNISGLVRPLRFRLTDDSGHVVDQSHYYGKVTMLYFGYTHCVDVCPDTLAKLGQAIRSVGPAGAGVRVLFVTVDPARDTATVLHRYVRAFGPEFVGLRGSNHALEVLARRYRVVYRRQKPDAHGDYEVTHSSGVFIFGRSGHARLLATSSDTATAIGHDLHILLGTG